MGTDGSLSDFVRRARESGLSDETTITLLRHNGWPERRIYRELSSHYAERLGMPVPSRAGRAESARDAFLYLLNFITLGFWSVALGQIFYILIAHWFPDARAYGGYGTGAITRYDIAWQAATTIVAFPVFLFVHALIQRQLRARPDLYESGVRRWLTYIALVIAAIIVIGDGVWFIQALIQGELTARFLLDSLVLLVLGGGIFAYYLTTMEPPVQQPQ
jgi:hypothetical protein